MGTNATSNVGIAPVFVGKNIGSVSKVSDQRGCIPRIVSTFWNWIWS
jgi:hypothetical protein